MAKTWDGLISLKSTNNIVQNEDLLFDSIFNFLHRIFLFSNSQLVLRPDDSCVHLLIAITQNILTVFDNNPSLEIRGIFLDLFKARDRLC